MAFLNITLLYYFFLSTWGVISLDWTDYQWIGIGDEGATALADPRVIKNFKTLE